MKQKVREGLKEFGKALGRGVQEGIKDAIPGPFDDIAVDEGSRRIARKIKERRAAKKKGKGA